MSKIGELLWTSRIDPSGVDRGGAAVEAKVRAVLAAVDRASATAELKADASNLNREIKKATSELAKLRSADAQVELGMDDTEFAAKYRETLLRVKNLERQRAEIKVRLDYDKSQVAQAARGLSDVERGTNRVENAVSSLGRKITSARVNIGPFTLTMRSLAVVSAGLAPILFDLGGAIVAIGASFSEAAAGAIAAGAGGLAGLGLAAGGAVMAIHPLITDMKTASTATAALTTAQLKYGKSSDEAKNASKQLDQVMKGMPRGLQQVMTQWQSLQAGFMQRTGGIRQSFLGDLSSALRSAKSLMPTFARDATSAFQTASRGWDQWMQGLRSPEAQHILDNIMSNFTRALPSLMHGLGQFATAFARIASTGSDFLTSFTTGFDRVGSDFAKSTSNANQLHSTIGGLVDQTHSWFSLLGATGHLLTTVISGGAESGQKVVDDLTDSINEWNRALQTAQGQRNMSQFFGQSVNTTEKLAGALRRVLTILFDLSRLTEPVAAGLLDFLNAVGDVGHWIAGLKPLRPLLEGIGIAIGTAFAVSKVRAFIGFMADAGQILMGLAAKLGFVTGAEVETAAAEEARAVAAGEAAAATEAEAVALDSLAVSAGAAGGAEGLLAVEGGSVVAASELGGVGVAAGAAEGELAGAAAASEGLGAAMAGAAGPLGIGAALIGFDIVDAIHSAAEESRKWAKAQEVLKQQAYTPSDTSLYEREADAIRHARTALNGLADATQKRKAAEQGARSSLSAYNQAVREHGRFSLQAAEAEDRWAREEHQSAAADARAMDQRRRALKPYNEAVNTSRDILDRSRQGFHDWIANARAQAQQAGYTGRQVQHAVRSQADYNRWLQIIASNEGAYTQRLNERAAASVNAERVTRGLQQTSRSSAQAIGQFARTFKGIPQVQKFLVQTNSRQAVQQVAQVANRVTALGGKKAVVSILANAKDPEQAFRRLSQAAAALTRANPVLSIEQKGAEGVLSILSRLTGVKLGDKTQNIKESGGDSVLGVLQRITSARIPNKSFSIVASASGAMSAISSVLGRLGAIPRVVTSVINVVTQHTGARAQGGPMIGGFPESSTPSKSASNAGRISRPTFITGEEAPMHPEYVIATNPAYRRANTVYLDQAASELGYALVPAYAAGKGAPTTPSLPPKPPKSAHGQSTGPRSWYAWYQHAIQYYDTQASDDQTANRVGKAVSDLQSEASYVLAQETEIGQILKHYKHVIGKGWKDYLSKGERKALHKHFHFRGKHKNESQKDYGRAKHQAHKAFQQHKHDIAQKAKQEEKQKANELKDSIPDLQAQLYSDLPQKWQEIQQQIKGIRTGSATQTALDQTASGQERYQALLQYAGNTSGLREDMTRPRSRFGGRRVLPAVPQPPTRGRHAPLMAGAAAAAGQPLTSSQMGALRAALAASGAETRVVNNEVHNHYKTMPTDPHTWSASLRHELGALLG